MRTFGFVFALRQIGRMSAKMFIAQKMSNQEMGLKGHHLVKRLLKKPLNLRNGAVLMTWALGNNLLRRLIRRSALWIIFRLYNFLWFLPLDHLLIFLFFRFFFGFFRFLTILSILDYQKQRGKLGFPILRGYYRLIKCSDYRYTFSTLLFTFLAFGWLYYAIFGSPL